MKYILSICMIFTFALPATLVAAEASTKISETEKDELFDELKELLTRLLQAQLSQTTSTIGADGLVCPGLERNLYIPNTGSDVTVLQNFLKDLGPSIYPNPQITGKYGTFTKEAVQRFQVKTGIFGPGQVGYGVTGPVTRKTIKEYCDNNTVISAPIIVPTTPATTASTNSVVTASEVTISSSVAGNTQIQNSTLFDPNSSSVFLQYLNPSQIQTINNTVGTTTGSVVLTPPSPVSKMITFTNTPSSVAVGESYVLSFTQSGFSGFDLVSIEGYKDDKQYFFGSTVPALGTYQITIPTVFAQDDSFTLIIKHNNDIKDSHTIQITQPTEAI